MDTYLSRAIHQLEQIEREETFPALQAADVLVDLLCEIATSLPAEEQSQIARIVALYTQCAYKQYGLCSTRNARKKKKRVMR